MSSSPIVTGQLPTWGLIFQCYVLWPFDAVCGALQVRLLESIATSFSSGVHFVGILDYGPYVSVGPAWLGS